jgi:putative phosphoesterase
MAFVTTRAAVLADTHIKDLGRTALPDRAWEIVRSAAVILHAGDIMGARFLDELRSVASVHAVRGNNDVVLPTLHDTTEFTVEAVRVGMIHDSGPRRGREARMRRRFPDADLVVFGHSHIPWDAPGVDGQHLFNPGSATLRRRQPHRTMGIVTIDGASFDTEIVTLD